MSCGGNRFVAVASFTGSQKLVFTRKILAPGAVTDLNASLTLTRAASVSLLARSCCDTT